MAENIENGEKKALDENLVKEALDMFRPMLQADGGDIEYVGIDDQNRVHLKMLGACGGCPMAVMDLKMGVEQYLKDACPEITEVVQDNAPDLGENGFDYF
ncbi:MAG: NifU family protein [Treponema sp.]|nr:NifU family protein [Treponema sp.]